MSAPLVAALPVAVVTGSSSGIGRATAIELSGRGFAIVLHARRNLAGLQRVAAELQSMNLGGRAQVLCITGDIACPRACQDMVAAAFAWRGRVDAWVNNAGADVLTGHARQQSFADRLQRLCDVDVQGTVCLSRLIAPRMLTQPPRATLSPALSTPLPCIVNLGWDQASLGMEGEPGQLFGTTKAAVAAFTMSLALSYPGIRVNCVAPGWIQTEWGQTSANSYWAQRASDESLQQRWGTAQDVAHTIAWLLADASGFVNGQTIAVNGGRRYYPPSS